MDNNSGNNFFLLGNILRIFNLILLSLVIIISTNSNISFAFQVSPLIIDLAPSGREASNTLTAVNTRDRVLTLDLGVYPRGGQKAGKQLSDEFLVFPPSAILQPGATQIFRIQWLGDPALESSQTFALNVGEVPVELPEEASAVQLVFQYNLPIHVSPPGAEPLPRVTKVATSNDDRGLVLNAEIANDGNKYTYTRDMKITVQGDGQRRELLPDDIRDIGANVFIPPHSQAEVEIPLGDGDWAEPIHVSLELIEEEG